MEGPRAQEPKSSTTEMPVGSHSQLLCKQCEAQICLMHVALQSVFKGLPAFDTRPYVQYSPMETRGHRSKKGWGRGWKAR